jgi:hypothetical protein
MGNVANGTGTPRWLQPVFTMLLVPALTTIVVVSGLAARYGQRLDTLEGAAEARWAGLNQRLGAEDEMQHRAGLVLERHDERISNLDLRLTTRGREIALQSQDFARLIGELRAELGQAQERIARLEGHR